MGRVLGFFSLSHKAQTNGVKQTYKCKNYRVPFEYEIFNIFHKTLNFFKNKGMKTNPKISKKKNIYTIQVNSKLDIELLENILYTSSNDYYLKRKKEKFK